MNQPNDIFADFLAGAFIVATAAIALGLAWKAGGCLARADEMPACTRERFNPECTPCCADGGTWEPPPGAITGWYRCDSAAYLPAHPCLVLTPSECIHGGSR